MATAQAAAPRAPVLPRVVAELLAQPREALLHLLEAAAQGARPLVTCQVASSSAVNFRPIPQYWPSPTPAASASGLAIRHRAVASMRHGVRRQMGPVPALSPLPVPAPRIPCT